MLTFGQLFGIVKTEGLSICTEIKLEAKHGSEGTQSRKEMGTFCEAFHITKTETPLAVRKRIHKR